MVATLREKRIVCFTLMFFVSILLPVDSHGQGDASMGQSVKRVMTNQFEISPIVDKQRKPFCRAFLRDFRQLTNIEFVEPIAHADSPDDSVWQPYKARCPDLAMFDSYECEPKIYESIKTLPKEQRDREFNAACRHYRGTKNFKLYHVDINNDPKDGKEHVFYYERAQGPLNRPGNEMIYANGGYTEVDMGRCEVKSGVHVNDPYSYFYKRSLRNYNGIISYMGKHYIFDLSEVIGSDGNPKKRNYNLQLEGYSKFVDTKAQSRLGPICAFSTLALPSK